MIVLSLQFVQTCCLLLPGAYPGFIFFLGGQANVGGGQTFADRRSNGKSAQMAGWGTYVHGVKWKGGTAYLCAFRKLKCFTVLKPEGGTYIRYSPPAKLLLVS